MLSYQPLKIDPPSPQRLHQTMLSLSCRVITSQNCHGYEFVLVKCGIIKSQPAINKLIFLQQSRTVLNSSAVMFSIIVYGTSKWPLTKIHLVMNQNCTCEFVLNVCVTNSQQRWAGWCPICGKQLPPHITPLG